MTTTTTTPVGHGSVADNEFLLRMAEAVCKFHSSKNPVNANVIHMACFVHDVEHPSNSSIIQDTHEMDRWLTDMMGDHDEINVGPYRIARAEANRQGKSLFDSGPQYLVTKRDNE